MILHHLVLNLLYPVDRFYPFYFHQVHDQVVKVFGVMDIKINVSVEDSIVAGEVDIPHIDG